MDTYELCNSRYVADGNENMRERYETKSLMSRTFVVIAVTDLDDGYQSKHVVKLKIFVLFLKLSDISLLP